MLVVPNVMGMVMWSPPLDDYGNSVRGIQFCQVRKPVFAGYPNKSRKSVRGIQLSQVRKPVLPGSCWQIYILLVSGPE